jgi:hypothetical protein
VRDSIETRRCIMHTTCHITSDGPYLHVLLRDVLPPDWEALRHELEPEIEEGATHVTFALARSTAVTPHDRGLVELVESLHGSGIQTVVLS